MNPVGNESNISYQDIFDAYKHILITNSYNNDGITGELFQYYNGIVFDWEADRKHKGKAPHANSGEDEPSISSGVDDAIRSHMDAMALHNNTETHHNPGGDPEETFEFEVSASLLIVHCLLIKMDYI